MPGRGLLEGMQVATVQVDGVQVHGERHADGEEGAVWYLVLVPHAGAETCCATHPGALHCYERQPFRRGTHGFLEGASTADVNSNRANVWGWDGNRETPTLSPSFWADRTGSPVAPYVLHCFFRAGRIDLCPDSTVRLETVPRRCVDADGGPVSR